MAIIHVCSKCDKPLNINEGSCNDHPNARVESVIYTVDKENKTSFGSPITVTYKTANQLVAGDVVSRSTGFMVIEKTVIGVNWVNGMFVIIFNDNTREYDNGLTGKKYTIYTTNSNSEVTNE